jgi:hypothetical protein
VARALRLRELRGEINDGINVMESWNGANAVIHYGRSGEFTISGSYTWRGAQVVSRRTFRTTHMSAHGRICVS